MNSHEEFKKYPERLEGRPKGFGDFHNFQQRTHPSLDEGWIIKPRCVFWEWLFLDEHSPIAHLFDFPLLQNSKISFRDFVFNQHIEMQNFVSHLGQARRIPEAQAFAIDQTDKFAALMAYSCAFGLADLHADNLIQTEIGPQIIDIEFVFLNGKSPDAFLLVAEDRTAYDTAKSFGVDINRPLIESFQYYCDRISQVRTEALKICVGFDGAAYPIRANFRPTREYYYHLSNTAPINNLLPSERDQLARQDIPYYFYTLNDVRTRYYTDTSGNYAYALFPPGTPSAQQRKASLKYFFTEDSFRHNSLLWLGFLENQLRSSINLRLNHPLAKPIL